MQQFPVTAANGDAELQSGTCTLAVDVIEILPIGTVQGVVTDDDNGLWHGSQGWFNSLLAQPGRAALLSLHFGL